MRWALVAVALLPSALGIQGSTDRHPSVCVYWTMGPESRPRLDAAGLRNICVPREQVDAWRSGGFDTQGIDPAELTTRTSLETPGIAARAGVASPTRAPWIVANGWRFVRNPSGSYTYDLAAGKAALAAAEASAYGVNAVLKIDQADIESVAAMMTFLGGLPSIDLPPVADLAVVDDGPAETGEVMNLLYRRNLLFEVVKAPSTKYRINVALGGPDYPRQAASDPSAFAQAIRTQLTDEGRSLRVYGSEVVIARLNGDGSRARLHLINYGGRDIEGLRIKLKGVWTASEALVAGAGRVPLADLATEVGATMTATEFSIPRLGTYAVVDLVKPK